MLSSILQQLWVLEIMCNHIVSSSWHWDTKMIALIFMANLVMQFSTTAKQVPNVLMDYNNPNHIIALTTIIIQLHYIHFLNMYYLNIRLLDYADITKLCGSNKREYILYVCWNGLRSEVMYWKPCSILDVNKAKTLACNRR